MMRVQQTPIDRVKAYEGNPRVVPQRAIEAVAESIRNFGWQQPIVVDEEHVVLAGHTRLQAAHHLGLEKVPVLMAKGLTPEQARAYRVVDNASAEQTGWDQQKLDEEMNALLAGASDIGIDWSLYDSLAPLDPNRVIDEGADPERRKRVEFDARDNSGESNEEEEQEKTVLHEEPTVRCTGCGTKLKVRPLTYFGGKSPASTKKLGAWVANLLPFRVKSLYCEPYAGMLGVLLCRPRCNLEMVNDLDGHVVNWWRIVRDRHEELAALLEATPYAREMFRDAQDELNAGPVEDPLRRAYLYHLCMWQSLPLRYPGKRSWGRRFDGEQINVSDKLLPMLPEMLRALAIRMRGIQIEQRPAVEILQRTAMEPATVIYCDPPYPTADKNGYAIGARELNVDELTEQLRAQRGYVAISGQGEEWDHLGWRRAEKETYLSANVVVQDGKQVMPRRTEVLWMNYDKRGRRLIAA